MTTQTIDRVGFTPVRGPLAVLSEMTDAQHERLRVLAEGFNPDRIELSRDSWMPAGVLFTLLEANGTVILHGLIEADGCANT